MMKCTHMTAIQSKTLRYSDPPNDASTNHYTKQMPGAEKDFSRGSADNTSMMRDYLPHNSCCSQVRR